MSTPIFDELEEKWNAVGYDRAICDPYNRCFLIETGAEWYEDDEGNEVFPEPRYAEGGLVEPVRTIVYKPDEGFVVPKPKFKLFGRNQGTNGVL